jgi:hypothetical protein
LLDDGPVVRMDALEGMVASRSSSAGVAPKRSMIDAVAYVISKEPSGRKRYDANAPGTTATRVVA